MISKRTLRTAALIGAIALSTTACTVLRGQSSAGEYIADSAITTQVKGKMGFDGNVSATAISVETLEGIVQLSGFAKSAAEKARAEEVARGVKGVKGVKNSIIVQP